MKNPINNSRMGMKHNELDDIGLFQFSYQKALLYPKRKTLLRSPNQRQIHELAGAEICVRRDITSQPP